MKTHAYTRPIMPLVLLLAGCPLLTAAQGVPTTKPPGDHVIIMGELILKDGRDQEFHKLVSQMKTRATHEDHGNIRYELFVTAAPPGQQSTSKTYIFLEEWQDQAAAAAHGKWAGPIVRTQWKDMSQSMKIMRLDQVPLE